jgi:hypothetical protein
MSDEKDMQDFIKRQADLPAAQAYKERHERLEALGAREAQNPNGMKLRTFEEKMRLYPDDYCAENPYKDADGWATHALEYGPGWFARVFLTKQYCVFCGHQEVPCC